MKICIAVSEFNPFHTGHAAFLARCKSETGADAVVCAMAGNFTQRGELAVMEKRARARLALSFGADAVVELPTPVAVANAERFALGAVSLFRGVKADLYLCCGSEIADRNLLLNAAAFFTDEPASYQAEIKARLKAGVSLPTAREQALYAVDKGEFAPIIKNPNATLALEYAKACQKHGITFTVYQRTGSYHAETLPSSGAEISGTAVRKAIAEGQKEALFPLLPERIYQALPSVLPSVDEGLFCALLSKEKSEIARLPDCSEGLGNRMFTALRAATSFADFLERVKTKRYVMSRIKRIASAALLGVTEELSRRMAVRAPYLRLLGVKKGAEGVLSTLATGKAPLLLRRKDAEGLTGFAKQSFLADERAEAVYRLSDGTEYPFFVKV